MIGEGRTFQGRAVSASTETLAQTGLMHALSCIGVAFHVVNKPPTAARRGGTGKNGKGVGMAGSAVRGRGRCHALRGAGPTGAGCGDWRGCSARASRHRRGAEHCLVLRRQAPRGAATRLRCGRGRARPRLRSVTRQDARDAMVRLRERRRGRARAPLVSGAAQGLAGRQQRGVGLARDRPVPAAVARLLRRPRHRAAVGQGLSRLLPRYPRFIPARRQGRRRAGSAGGRHDPGDPGHQGTLSGGEADLQPRLRDPAAGA